MSMQTILAASQSLSRMQTMQSTRTQIQGTANILRAESKQDGGNAQKDAKIEELDEKAGKLMGDLMAEMDDVNETLKPDEEVEEGAADAKEETETRSSKTDVVQFSDAATKQARAGAPAKATAPEAVTYKADGSKAPDNSGEATPTFKATA